MKNFVVAFLIIIISVVSSKPIEEDNGSVHKRSIYKRQLPDVTTLNKQFFDQIFQATRITRDTDDVNAVPTIALHDLISSVEHTLIHSAQNLAASNVTRNSTTTVTESESNNASNIQHNVIVLPITIPTPAPQNEIVTEAVDTTTVIGDENQDEADSIRDNRSSEKIVSEHKEVDFETVKPIENSNLGILFPIALNPSANISRVVKTEDKDDEEVVTEETKVADQHNITILQTINSTQVIPTQSDVVHFHQQQITLFSANAGVFPNIHAIKAEDFPVLVQSSSAEPELDDCSAEETSVETSDDDASSSEDQSSSSSSSEEKEKLKKPACSHRSSVATSKTVESSTPSVEAVKKIKSDELKEKIAEVEADPVILTQGI